MKFQDDISNMNTYVHTYIHTYIRTSRNQYVPYFFKVGGIKKSGRGVREGGSGWGRVGGGQGGCERRIEVFVKIKKKKNCRGGVGSGEGGLG